jgi:hypothetical protein
MTKFALIFLSIFSLSAFASELDQPVSNVSNREKLMRKLPATVIVRSDESGKSTSGRCTKSG